MFCNNCGKKYPRESKVCPYCGEKQNSLSEGNGFFDMFPSKNTGEMQNNAYSESINVNNNDETMYLKSMIDKQSKQIYSLQKGQRRIAVTFLILVTALALLFIVNMAYTHGTARKLNAAGKTEQGEMITTPQPQINLPIQGDNEGGEGYEVNETPEPTLEATTAPDDPGDDRRNQKHSSSPSPDINNPFEEDE